MKLSDYRLQVIDNRSSYLVIRWGLSHRPLLDSYKVVLSEDRITSLANSFSYLDVSSDKTIFARANSPWERAILRKSSLFNNSRGIV